jgi:hypothetical protein
LSGSLLVLPEAFNIGTRYSCHKPIQKDPRILCDLQELCAEYDCCVVAGLIVEGPNDRGIHPYSSAYLIDVAGAELLCRKVNYDSQGPYTTCIEQCDSHNAKAYRNIALCSLVCMDGYEAAYNRDRHEQLEKKMTNVLNAQYRIVCVPAYIEATMNPRFWSIKNSYRVVANSASRTEFPYSPGSFVEWINEHGETRRLVELEDSDDATCIKFHDLSGPLNQPSGEDDVVRN